MSKHFFARSFLSLLLIASLSLININPVLADDTVPPTATAEPVQGPTQEPTQDTASATEEPVQATATDAPTVEATPLNSDPAPAGEEASPSTLFSQVPDETDLVVLDDNGESIPLATSEALNIILETDPMWCPAGALPGDSGCTNNYASISLLINELVSNTSTYDKAGIIYFTGNPGASFSLTTDSLGSSVFTQLSDNNLTLQGGWNGINGAGATFVGQTNFATNSLTIGSLGNAWGGNITLNNFSFNGVTSTNAVTVYTSNGDIELSNVDVAQQGGGFNTAKLVSSSGDITVTNGSTFDGNTGNTNQGFNASTTSGTISITGTAADPITFTDAAGTNSGSNFNGASLSAPTVTLNYVTATNNDLNGIYISNANTVTLNHIISGDNTSGNGTNPPGGGNSDTVGSGVYILGTSGTVVTVSNGYFANNERYGIELTNGSITINSTSYGTRGDANTIGNYAKVSNTAPVLNLPANITASATSLAGRTVTFTVTSTDAEDNPEPIPTCAPASGTVFPIATTTVNCTATDSKGASSFGSFKVTINDTTVPVIAAHANVTAEATSSAGATVTYTSPSTSDALDGPGTATCTPASGTVFALGNTTVTCNATDPHGNAAIPTTFTVTVRDTTRPTIASHTNVTAEATSAAGAVVTYTSPATSDLVDGAGVATCVPASGSTFALGNTTVTCNATDAHGNAALPTTFTVTVQDTTAPTLNLPANMTVEATNSNGAVVTYSASASDLVDGPVSISCLPASGSAFIMGTTTVNCSASDTRSHTANGSFTVTVQDKTAPTLNLPANMTIEATSSAGATVTYSASATDAVDGALPVTCSPASGSNFAFGATTVNCSATDSKGNTANGSFTVTVQDTTAPTIAAHTNVTVEATSAAGAIVAYTSPSTSDIVDGAGTATCTPASGTTFALGSTTITCNATDTHSNAATPVTFTITVEDTTAPTLNLPANMTVEATGGSGATVTYSASASDLVDGSVSVSCLPASGSSFAIGVTTINCSATDSKSNNTNGSFTITVQDTTRPTIAAHTNVTAEAASASGAVVTYTSPATSDLVDGAGVATCVPASGSTFALGNTTVTCNATDAHGNAALPTTFTVTVQDTTAPTLNLPANMTVEATSASGATVTYSASASDLVDTSVTVSCVPASGNTFGLGTTTVNCSATDDYSNTATGNFTITVQDRTAPALNLPANMTVEATSISGATVTYSASATDVVDGALPVTCSPASGSNFAFGATTVNCSATDSDKNTANGSFTVTVQDTIAPVIAQPANITVVTNNSQKDVVMYQLPSTTDAVDGAGVASCTPASGSTFNVGNTLVTCTAVDSHGNASEPVTFTVTLKYIEPVVPPTGGTALIPVTGDETIALDCNTEIMVQGIKVTFFNLCERQAIVNSLDAKTLPAKLPTGFTFVTGLNVSILDQSQLLKVLPAGAGIEIDFPASNGQFALLYWNNGQWVEITQTLNEADITNALSKDAVNELYKIISSGSGFAKALTTENTGIFVLVKK